MFFEHIYDKTLAQGSYLIGCQALGSAIVIDAKRDVDTYIEIAKKNQLRITHITETHIHADFLSGSRELAQLTGAELLLSNAGPAEWQYDFEHTGLYDADRIKVGNIELQVLHTPGHTPESLSFIVYDTPATPAPLLILTGDFVFVGDVGRPDLLEKSWGEQGSEQAGAVALFESLQKFKNLPPYLQVWPGHGAGSACGKSLGAVASSTVGYEVIRNWALQYANQQEDFVQELLANQPEVPRYFAQMKKRNKERRALLPFVPKQQHLKFEEFSKLYKAGMTIIDTRPKAEFAKSFLPNTIHIQNNNAFSTWAGWLLDYSQEFVIIAEAYHMEDITRKLMRIGLDRMAGYITPTNLRSFDLPTAAQRLLSLDEMHANLDNPKVEILDVRNEKEYKEGHIRGAKNLFVGTILDHLDQINRKKQIIVYCQSGDRATLAQSLLYKAGFHKVWLYSGGIKEWKANNEQLLRI